MRWTGDTSRGAWLPPRLGEFGSVTGNLPGGFAAYARVFHPLRVWVGGEERPSWTWAQAAERAGRVQHALAQWTAIVGRENPFDTLEIDDLEVGPPADGGPSPELLASLIGPLRAATTTPDEVVLGIWDGWGTLHVHSVSTFVWAGRDTDPAEVAALQASAETDFRQRHEASLNPDVRSAVERDGGFPGDNLLKLQHRAYVLLEGSLDQLADPAWPHDAGIGWFADHEGPPPQLLWPADHAWCLGSDVDWDTTVIGGSAELVAAICSTPGVEALPLRPGDHLGWFEDTVNR